MHRSQASPLRGRHGRECAQPRRLWCLCVCAILQRAQKGARLPKLKDLSQVLLARPVVQLRCPELSLLMGREVGGKVTFTVAGHPAGVNRWGAPRSVHACPFAKVLVLQAVRVALKAAAHAQQAARERAQQAARARAQQAGAAADTAMHTVIDLT
jgi:hypothetical protein